MKNYEDGMSRKEGIGKPIDYFKIFGIDEGDKLYYRRDETITCMVVDVIKRKVYFRGELMSLTTAAEILLKEEGDPWTEVQGSDYWCRKEDGKSLHRERLEKEKLEGVSGQAGSSGKVSHSREDDEFLDGKRVIREIVFFKRNSSLVRKAKDHYGYKCMACDFAFKSKYGKRGKDYIECHHENALSERPSEEWNKEITTSIEQIKVLCSNCHRMVHRYKPALTFDKLKEMLKERKVRNETAEFECYGMKPWKVNAQRRRHRDFQRGPKK